MDNSAFLKIIMSAIPVGERTRSSDFSIFTNARNLEELQRIAFLDSRGKKIFPDEDPHFIGTLLAKEWDLRHEKYLILTRTHASTTFFTLVNFLNNLQIRIPYLLTNVGFVDFTPKKKSVIDDIIVQARELFPDSDLKLIDLERYRIASGEIENLVVLDMFPIADKLTHHLVNASQKTVFIGTHEISESIQFERERPASFYSQLQETNKFLKLIAEKMISSAVFVRPLEIHGRVQDSVFDGVHFTRLGHESLFQKLLAASLI